MAAARRLFETIGVWERVTDGAQPILDMVVTDSRLHDAVRPVFLTFDGDVEPGEPFAHMIENAPLLAALVEKAKEVGVELHAVGGGGHLAVSAKRREFGRGHRTPWPSRSRTAPCDRSAALGCR